MRIVSEKALREFAAKHNDAVAALMTWRNIVRHADWKNGAEVKASFPNSDMVGDKTVFNIALNRFRLIAFISFRARIVFVKAILTHKQYDKGEWKK